jgi:hypothetical protein
VPSAQDEAESGGGSPENPISADQVRLLLDRHIALAAGMGDEGGDGGLASGGEGGELDRASGNLGHAR